MVLRDCRKRSVRVDRYTDPLRYDGLSPDIENLIFMTARFTGRNLAIVHDFVNVTIMETPLCLRDDPLAER